MLQIRKSTSDDLKAILDIYNEAVLNTTATFDTAARTFEKQLEWYENHKANTVIVALMIPPLRSLCIFIQIIGEKKSVRSYWK